MYEFSKSLTITAKNYNLQERDIAFCYLVAAGVDRADAFHVIFQHGSKTEAHATHDTTDNEASKYINNHAGIKLLIQKIKARQPINTTNTQQEVRTAQREQDNEEEENKKAAELKTREGLTKKLRFEISNTHGKDSVQGLIQLAKLEGYDKEDNRTEEEKRRYFLPYRSRCRGCKLMHFYRDLEDKTQDDTKTESEK